MKKTIYLLLIALSLFGCSNNTPKQDLIPNHDNFTIESKQVNETRTINVWTPDGYKDSTGSYPVIYMLDGGIKEDFPHVANTIAKLISEKQIPPFILVGIENTVRRRDLTGSSQVASDEEVAPIDDGAKIFRAFINEELFTKINSQYRTTTNKGIIGESVAGLFIVETLLLKPDMFDFYIAIDPSLWWNNAHLVKTAKENLATLSTKNIKLWFAGSSAIDISQNTKTLEKTLTTNAPKNLNWNYSDEPNEEHHTIFRATKEKALIWSLNN